MWAQVRTVTALTSSMIVNHDGHSSLPPPHISLISYHFPTTAYPRVPHVMRNTFLNRPEIFRVYIAVKLRICCHRNLFFLRIVVERAQNAHLCLFLNEFFVGVSKDYTGVFLISWGIRLHNMKKFGLIHHVNISPSWPSSHRVVFPW